MSDIQEGICFEYTAQILPPLGAPRGGGKKILRFVRPRPTFISVYALEFPQNTIKDRI